MAKTNAQPRGIDRIAALMEPAFPLRMLGFGLIYAWSTCLWDIPLFTPFGDGVLQTDASWMLSAALTPIACIGGSLIGRARELADYQSLYIIGPVLTTVGTLFAIAHPYLIGSAQTAAYVLAGVGTGIGPVILILLWTCLFARSETGIVETALPASFVATLLCALVVPAFRGGLAIVIVAMLPLASGALLLLSKRALEVGAIAPEETDNLSASGRVRNSNIVRIFFVIFAVYSMGCLLPAASPTEISTQGDTGATIIGMLFALTLAACIVLFSRHINLEAVFRWISVPFVFSVIGAALGVAPAVFASRALMNAVFTGIEIIMVLYFIRLAQKTGRNSTFFVGIGECAAYAGVFAGYMTQLTVRNLIDQGVLHPAIFCLFLVGVFTATALLVPRHDVVWADEQSSGTDEFEIGLSTAVPLNRSTIDEAIAAQRIAIALRYGLSNRETEIFLMLAQGRSRPYIRDTLVLSKNTVATHIRHIYEKLDIHSQQELIDLAQVAE